MDIQVLVCGPGVGTRVGVAAQIRPGVGILGVDTPAEAGTPGVDIVAAGQIRPGVDIPGVDIPGADIPGADIVVGDESHRGVGPRAFGVLADALPYLALRRFHHKPYSYSVFGQDLSFDSLLKR